VTQELDRLQIRKQLQDARDAITQNLGLREQVHIEHAADEMDEVQAAAARDLAITNLNRSARWLRQIDDALFRLDAGEYGRCANCDEEIGAKRLSAVPWAAFCLGCQEMADRGEIGDRGPESAESLLDAA
jgi:RNA polymerase-binding transcription factor